MKVIDSSLNILSPNFKTQPNHWNIVNNIEVDTLFISSYSGLITLEPH